MMPLQKGVVSIEIQKSSEKLSFKVTGLVYDCKQMHSTFNLSFSASHRRLCFLHKEERNVFILCQISINLLCTDKNKYL